MIWSTEINSNRIYDGQGYFKQDGNLESNRAHYDVTVMQNQATRFVLTNMNIFWNIVFEICSICSQNMLLKHL